MIVIVTSGCIDTSGQHNGIQNNTSLTSDNLTPSHIITLSLSAGTSDSETAEAIHQPYLQQNTSSVIYTPTPTRVTGLTHPPDNTSAEIVLEFVRPLNPENLTFANMADANLSVLISDDAVFFVSLANDRVQSATWTGAGPKIFTSSLDANQSCALANAFVEEKYLALRVMNPNREMLLTSASPSQSNPSEYRCHWSEILYMPGKNVNAGITTGGRTAITIILDPTTGRIRSYEETYPFIRPGLDLNPALFEKQAWAVAEKWFEQQGITGIQPSERTSAGLYLSNDDPEHKRLVWAFEVRRYRPMLYGGLIGIDAHDGSIAYHASFL